MRNTTKKMEKVVSSKNSIVRAWKIAIVTITSSIALTGCGALQATKDGTVDAAKWVFTTQVKTMNVDLDARAAANETTSGQSLSTVVRLYQLKDSKTFAQLEYVQLQNNDLELLKTDLVATKDVVLRPGSSASVSEPMDKDAQYVGVVAFFRQPTNNGVWKLLIPKAQWKDTDPVKIHVQSNLLAYEGANPKPIRREAPQQSAPAQKASPGMAANGAAGSAANNAANSAANSASNDAINPAAALGEAADSGVYKAAPVKAAAQSVSAAANSLSTAKAGAGAASRNAAALIGK